MQKILLLIATLSLLTQASSSNLCASFSQRCGHPQEGQSPCCSGYTCIWPSDALPGSQGFCMSPTELCATKGKKCGLSQEGGSPCCSGYDCVYPEGQMGAQGVCTKKSSEVEFLSASLCAENNENCGAPQEGQKNCCDGYKCVYNGPLGAPGKCKKESLSAGLCAVRNEECGLSAEGRKECCDGYKCDFDPQLIGGAGVCRPQTEIQLRLSSKKLLCAPKGQHCGLPQEGQKECCAGYHCVWYGNALGAPGICEASTLSSSHEVLCADKGETCGLEREGKVSCCGGYECLYDRSKGLGAPGQCVKKSNNLNFSVCAAENDKCGLEEEGQQRCCNGLQCLFTSPMAGAPGRCVKQ